MKWKFKKNAEPQGAGDFWYDLTDGGYIKPEEVLADKKQLERLKEAVALIQSFHHALNDADLMNEI